MDEIKDEVQAILDDMTLTLYAEVIKMSFGEYGVIPDDTMDGIAIGLGKAVAGIYDRAGR